MRIDILAAALLTVTAGAAAAQDAPPAAAAPEAQAAPAAAAQAAAAAKTVAQTASPELVGQLVSELAITPAQAEGAAGAMFNVAKAKLSPADFAKVAGTVPNMTGLLAAAPGAGKPNALEAIVGKNAASTVGGVAAAAGALSKLGLSPAAIAKLAPSMVKFVQGKGGAETAGLLAGALK